ncbi:MAG: hypothetical protein WAO40_04835 [Candidatus Nanopelagicales bacterium]|nr:hypothetical protein [Candidatus Nanopelagicales bacterium]MDP4825416.1 hypothetical protein [Candidatus Nanopelagicales bacterium]MDP4887511.1 hypothetical protein [Candidatus Nanopelagicales bacterium]
MLDSLKGYLTIATGVTEVTLTRAREVAAALVSEGFGGGSSDAVGGVQELADELWTTGKDNREMLLQVVRLEVDRAVARMGFVREDELASLRRQVDRLETELVRAREELEFVRQDAAAGSILAAAEHEADAQLLADSVIDSARRMVSMTGALAAVPGLAQSPWARLAKDLATSAADMMTAPSTGAEAPGEAAPPKAAPKKAATKTASATTTAPSKAPAKKAGANKAAAKKAGANKAAAKKASAKKANLDSGTGE